MTEKKENRNVLISFRLTESEFLPYKKIISDADLNKTEFFRAVFLHKKPVFRPNNKKDTKNVIFEINKIGNNLNQIAKKLNEDSKRGIISQRSYSNAINRLISIEWHLNRLLEKC